MPIITQPTGNEGLPFYIRVVMKNKNVNYKYIP